MYDRDQVLNDLPAAARFSRSSCAELKWPTVAVASGPRGRPFCVGSPQASADKLTLAQAWEHCGAAAAPLVGE